MKFNKKIQALWGLQVFFDLLNCQTSEYTAAPAEGDAVRGDTGNILKIMLNSPLKNPKVKFAQTGYYEVNLYNEEMIPALPFEAGRKIRILQDGILR